MREVTSEVRMQVAASALVKHSTCRPLAMVMYPSSNMFCPVWAGVAGYCQPLLMHTKGKTGCMTGNLPLAMP